MAYLKRKVSFYLLSLDKLSDDKKKTIFLSHEEIKARFNYIYSERMHPIANDRKALDVQIGSGFYVIEIIEQRNNLVFAKIGKQNPADTVALRDQRTLESETIPMTETQALELFTYFLIDFDTGIISYIGIGGIPKISAIKGMFSNNLSEEGISTRVSAIVSCDILHTIMQKNTISKIEFSIAVPNDEVLSNKIGLSLNDFDSISNVKSRTASFKLVAKRNKNIFHTNTRLVDLFNSTINQFGDRLIAYKVNAKDDGEPTQTYDLLEYHYTQVVPLGVNDQITLSESDFQDALYKVYNANKQELLRYTRQ